MTSPGGGVGALRSVPSAAVDVGGKSPSRAPCSHLPALLK